MSSQSAMNTPQVRAEAATDVGRVRDHNEDCSLLVPEWHLYLLADGMGGHNAGEVASRVALEAAREFFVRSIEQSDSTWPYPMRQDLSLDANRLRAALLTANTRVLDESRVSAERAGMGTTVVALAFQGGQACVAHLGDSRAYRIRGGAIEQLTEDHSLVQEQLRAGLLSQADANASPYKNVITRACGIREGVEPDLTPLAIEAGDLFLLCSDGLSNLVAADAMARLVGAAGGDLAAAAKALVDAANAAGGDDNITVVLVAVDQL